MGFSNKFRHLLLTLIVSSFCNLAYAKIVKWVDEKGVTHYGDSLPTQYTGRSTTEISQRGIVLKQNKPVDTKAEQLNQEQQEQDKKDKVLLASYSSAQEIDAARDRNLQLDLATLQNLAQEKQSVESRNVKAKKTRETLIKQKKPFPAYLTTELASIQDETTKVDAQVAERKASMEQTKHRYELEKLRFITLKSTSNNPSTSPSVSNQ